MGIPMLAPSFEKGLVVTEMAELPFLRFCPICLCSKDGWHSPSCMFLIDSLVMLWDDVRCTCGFFGVLTAWGDVFAVSLRDRSLFF